jgi:hypothetical protein
MAKLLHRRVLLHPQRARTRAKKVKGREEASNVKKAMTFHHSSGFDNTIEYQNHLTLISPWFATFLLRVFQLPSLKPRIT